MKGISPVIPGSARRKAVDAITLVEASLRNLQCYDPRRSYTPKELEPYDALSSRFIRAVESTIKFFRGYEKYLYGENSETLRDLLNRMHKLDLISGVTDWIRMRDVRNRVAHDYLPEQIKLLYDLIMGDMGKELLSVKQKLLGLNLAKSNAKMQEPNG